MKIKVILMNNISPCPRSNVHIRLNVQVGHSESRVPFSPFPFLEPFERRRV